MEALKSPGVIKYAITFACVKGSTYGILFWLPNYLKTVIGFGKEAAFIAAMYEVGQFFGALILGYCTDKMKIRSVGACAGLAVSAVIFIMLDSMEKGTSANTFGGLLFCAGFFFGAPEVIIGGVIASDLGEN